MKKLVLFILSLFVYSNVQAQCPTGNVIIYSQATADEFAVNYPDCTELPGNLIIDRYFNTLELIENLNGLNQLTSIGLDLIIEHDSLTNLTGLENLTTIGRDMEVRFTRTLVNLEGLENLTTIGENLVIGWPHDNINITNLGLTDLTGLNGLTTVGGSLDIQRNLKLNSVAALENLTTVGGSLNITRNDSLSNLEGLENLSTIGEHLYIQFNDVLTGLTNSSNLTSVGGDIDIRYNALTSLAGLENLNAIEGDMTIREDNLTSLTTFNNLDSIYGDLYLYAPELSTNLAGWSNLTFLGGDATLILSGNLVGLENLTTHPYNLTIGGVSNLTGLDNLTYVGRTLRITGANNLTGLNSLTHVGEDVVIVSNHAMSLAGLNNLTTIGGTLEIRRNDNLIDISGLTSLTTIWEDLEIDCNNALINLTGLDSLTFIGRRLDIGGDFWDCPPGNDNLQNLSGLENLTHVGEYFWIRENDKLATLEHLANLMHIGSQSLYITGNDSLSFCHIESICNYLDDFTNSYLVYGNAPDCNSRLEVIEKCMPLPIEMTAPLRVYLDGQTAILRWRTETETNNIGFEIQRSKDGINWEKIGWQAGQGTTTTSHTYSHRDSSPLSGISYYWLKQVDVDGNFEYSNAVSLRYIPAVVEISPNPSEGIFQINGIPQGTYQIHDTTGRTIRSGNMKNDLSIDISQEAQGVYFMSIQMENETITKRIIKIY